MKRLFFCFMAMMGVLTLSAQSDGIRQSQSIYDFKVKDDVGQEVSLSDYKGKVLLIVNTATRCGFTPQYKELEAMYEKYHAEGLEILDFPCNQFGEQAPGTIQEIHTFCTANFDIQFPQFDKKADIKWNFTKFLVSRDGRVLKRYEPTDKMSDIEADLLMEVCSGK